MVKKDGNIPYVVVQLPDLYRDRYILANINQGAIIGSDSFSGERELGWDSVESMYETVKNRISCVVPSEKVTLIIKVD